mgnify:CR=1 FL=1
MKTIIAGSRTIEDASLLASAIKGSTFKITEVVCGGANGADKLGELWARDKKIPVKYFYPDWASYGKSAGPRRNALMAGYAEALIALWDGKSRGTKNMIELAQKQKLKVYVQNT